MRPIVKALTGFGKDTLAVGHYDVFALASDAEACFFERFHGPKVVDTGNARHGLHGDLDLTNYHASSIVDCHLNVLADGIRDVCQGFLFRCPLGRTTRKAWNPDGESLFGLVKRHPVFHRPPPESSRSEAVNERVNLALSGLGRAVRGTHNDLSGWERIELCVFICASCIAIVIAQSTWPRRGGGRPIRAVPGKSG